MMNVRIRRIHRIGRIRGRVCLIRGFLRVLVIHRRGSSGGILEHLREDRVPGMLRDLLLRGMRSQFQYRLVNLDIRGSRH